MMFYRLRTIVITNWIGVLVMAQTTTDLVLPRGSDLKIPPGEKKIFVALGKGFQLYKCAAAPGGTALTWTSAGASADLFDLTGVPSPEKIPDELMRGGRSTAARPTLGDGGFKNVGKHFFTQAGGNSGKPHPVFIVQGQTMNAGKVASTPSPGKPERNADWLQLKVTPATGFAKSIFRTSTRGGQLAKVPCTQEDTKLTKPREVPYAALYSFFK
ncbi:hypothetical protein PGT21_027322 [Puccinia graminis f. sp. tritici]|uniref:Uncharacterized protein n=1 Tax=Puccinia graminis f. sp. tritici TaxID=56615 RepID=A0A5B0M0E3_PUCGR|nr:hypothetical protein PGT21_027322 [Puccinia graminis f. sp. tritici]